MMVSERQIFLKLKNRGNFFEPGQCVGPVTVSSSQVITQKKKKRKEVVEA